MDLEMINLTLLNISGMLEEINNSLSNKTSNVIAICSCIIAGIGCLIALISAIYSWKSQKDNFFKNTFDTLIFQFRTELAQVNKADLRCDLFTFLQKVYSSDNVDFNKSNLINDSKYVNCFVIIYRILKVIDEESIDNKGNYIGIIRAIIPNDILLLLALNSLQTNKDGALIFKRYKELLEKYNIFKHIKSINPFVRESVEESYIQFFAEGNLYTCYKADPFNDILLNFRKNDKT